MNGFELKSYNFKFQIGEIILATVKVPLQLRVIRLTDEILPVDKPILPKEPLVADSEGFVLNCLPVSNELKAITLSKDYICYAQCQYLHCYISLVQGFKSYSEKFSSKFHSTLRRKTNKFKRHCSGHLKWKAYTRPEEIQSFFDYALTVSSKTYQEKLLDAGLPDSSAFMEEARELARKDALRTFILFDGDRPVSYLYCPVKNGVLLYDYLGYDPEYRNLSVGSILQWIALESIFKEDKFSYFDFTEGDSSHKRQYSTNLQLSADIIFIRKTTKNSIIVYSHFVTSMLSKFIGDVLGKLGIKEKVKKILRFGL